MTKIIKFPDQKPPHSYFTNLPLLEIIINSHRKEALRYGMAIGFVVGAAFTLLSFTLSFLLR